MTTTNTEPPTKEAAAPGALSQFFKSSLQQIFVFAALLLAFLTIWWVTHDGPGPH